MELRRPSDRSGSRARWKESAIRRVLFVELVVGGFFGDENVVHVAFTQ